MGEPWENLGNLSRESGRRATRSRRTTWENLGRSLGEPEGILGRTLGEPWENLGNLNPKNRNSKRKPSCKVRTPSSCLASARCLGKKTKDETKDKKKTRDNKTKRQKRKLRDHEAGAAAGGGLAVPEARSHRVPRTRLGKFPSS